MVKAENVILEEIQYEPIAPAVEMVHLSDQCYQKRLSEMREKMKEKGLDAVVVYADREHYTNFKFFAGFEPRFEEGVLVIHREDPSYIILGNECYNMYQHARLNVKPILGQVLSLPGQPLQFYRPFEELLTDAGLTDGMKTGMIGWKYFTKLNGEGYEKMFDIPAFIVEAVEKCVGKENMVNATGILINPFDGLRMCCSAEEIAAFEFGASMASQSVLNMLENLKPGKREYEAGMDLFSGATQYSCHPMLSTGENTKKGLVSPSDTVIQLGDAFTTSMGLVGGLTCRAGYVAEKREDLPEAEQDYFEKIVQPYFAAVASWYEEIGIGVQGGDLYDVIQEVLPKEKYGWVLTPGHLISDEEWSVTNISHDNDAPFKSGMMVQMDIIPIPEHHACINAEDGICLADQALRQEIAEKYPKVWERMQKRRKFMIEEVGINLKEEVLPLSDMAGYYFPYLLNRKMACKIRK